MTAVADHPDAAKAPTARPERRWLARALVAIASLLAFLSLHAIWLNRQLLNTDNWTSASSQMLDNPAIRDQTAAFLTDQLYENVDVEAEIAAALPERLQFLAQPAANQLRDRVQSLTEDALTRPKVQQLWEDANRSAHVLLLRTLEGGGPAVSTQGGDVVLNLKALLGEIQGRTGLGGRVESALPASAAQIRILRSNQLEAAQDGVRVVKGLPIVLIVLSLALFGAALLVSPGYRRQVVRGFGIGLVLAGIAALAVGAIAGDLVVDELATTAALEPTVRGVWEIYTSLLRQAAVAAIFYGIVLVLGAWLAGPQSWAASTRRFLAPYLRQTALAYAAFAVLLLVVIAWWAPTPAMRNPVTAVLLALLLAGGFEGLRRVTAREFPPAA